MVKSLIKFWNRAQFKNGDFIHNEDLETLASHRSNVKDFKTFIKLGWNEKPHLLHPKIFPSPYAGNLQTAKVVLLLLNPGLSYSNYYFEQNNPSIKDQLEDSLKQDFTASLREFPFMWLNPENCGHEGFHWWEKKLRSTVQEVARRKKITYLEALKLVSKTIASIDLVPYHSRSGPPTKLRKAASATIARSYVKECLESNNGQTFVLLRSERDWLKSNPKISSTSKNLKCCKQIKSRSIHLGLGSTASNVILKNLGPMA